MLFYFIFFAWLKTQNKTRMYTATNLKQIRDEIETYVERKVVTRINHKDVYEEVAIELEDDMMVEKIHHKLVLLPW